MSPHDTIKFDFVNRCVTRHPHGTVWVPALPVGDEHTGGGS